MKTCFVISPIGAEGSEVREHANDVYDYIIKPAMEKCGIEAFRSDHLMEPGKISDQMYEHILGDTLCVAVLTYHNPNVFYELAIALAAARPVIVLVQKDETLPFDVQDLRCVYYDLRPRGLFEGIFVDEIAKHVNSLERAGWRGRIPIGDGSLDPLGGWGHDFRYLPKSAKFGDSDDWLQLLAETQTGFDIMGIALSSWRGTKRVRSTVAAKAAEGCKMRALIMHADNPALRHLIYEDEGGIYFDRVVSEINQMAEFFTNLALKNEGVEMRQIQRGCPHFQLVRTDQCAVLIPYLYSDDTSDSPLWQCAKGHPLYSTVEREFSALWDANASAQALAATEESPAPTAAAQVDGGGDRPSG